MKEQLGTTLPLCRNCDWASNRGRFAKCKHPSSAELNMVTGETETHSCSTARMLGMNRVGMCGEDGRFFTPRKPHWLKRLWEELKHMEGTGS